MSNAFFEHMVVTLSIGGGAQRVALSFYELSDGLHHCWIDQRPSLESFLWRLELSFRKTGGVPRWLEMKASRPFLKPKSNDWCATFKRFCLHFGIELVLVPPSPMRAVHGALIDWLQCQRHSSMEHCQDALDKYWPSRHRPDDLRTLPTTPFISATALFRRVAGDGFLSYGGDAYSVPDEYRGKSVWVQVQGGEVMVCSKEGRTLANHPSGSGYGDVILQKRHFVRRQSQLPLADRRAFLACFPGFDAFLAGLVAQRGSEAKATVRTLIELAGQHKPGSFERALDSALKYNNFSLRFIQGCLNRPSTATQTASSYEQGALF